MPEQRATSLRATSGARQAALRWLHLTDLHQGMGGHAYLWPQIEHLFLSDLERVHRRCGPLDLVLFTGDLTQRGTAEEFRRLEEALCRLWDRLRRLGSDPVLLAVPGNHDLVRPGPRDPAVLLLQDRWLADRELREEFFGDPASSYRKLIAAAFAPYEEFCARHRLPRPAEVRPGLLPGEFAATIRKDGVSLGVLGLNSAFLQLTANDYQGRLCLHPMQFHAATGGDGPAWAARHDLCLLLTHHPPSWLSPESQRDLAGEIATPGRFAVHLFGHMHEHTASTVSVGGEAPVRQWQGCSLFGLESFGEQGAERRHGYAAGCVEVRGGEARMRIWPRRAVRRPHGPISLVPDYQGFDLDDDHGTRPEIFALPPRPAPPLIVEAAPPRPGGPYRREFYVSRPLEERTAMAHLGDHGSPVLLWGSSGCGKTWLLGHLLERVQRERGPAARVVALDLGRLPEAAFASLDCFARAFATAVAAALGGDSGWIEELWRRPGTPGTKLSRFMEERALPTEGSLILALDSADALFSRPFETDFFGFLRAWTEEREEPAWAALRLVLVLSITPAQLTRKGTQSPLLNLAVQIHLRDFDSRQVGELLNVNGVRRSRRDVPALMALVGGNPYLLQLALSHAAAHGLRIKEFDGDEEVVGAAFAEHLGGVEAWLRERPPLLAAVLRLLDEPQGTLDPGVYDPLHRAGLLAWDEERGYHVPYRLYEAFLRRLDP